MKIPLFPPLSAANPPAACLAPIIDQHSSYGVFMETQDEFFQYLEVIYEQQAHCLESLKSYVGLSDDDPNLLEFAKSKNYFPVTNQPGWTDQLAEVFSMRWKDRDEKRTTYYSFDSRTTMNIFNATYDDGQSTLFEVTLEGGDFGVEFIVRLDGDWRYEAKWVKEEALLREWFHAPKEVLAVYSANDVYLEPSPGWIHG